MIKAACLTTCDIYKLISVTVLKKIVFTLILVVMSVFGIAQNAIVLKGVVQDDEGKPLSAVSVGIKGVSSGVTTGADGAFTIAL